MRRLTIIALSLIAAIAVALLLLPWWLGFLLNWIGGSFGAEFSGYARQGYGSFSVERAEIKRGKVVVEIHDLRGPTPLLWLWDRSRGHPDEITARNWSVNVAPRDTPPDPRLPRGWMPLKKRLDHVADILDRWLPRASVGPGEVAWKSGHLSFAGAKWEKRKLITSEVEYRGFKSAVEVTVTPDGELHGIANASTQPLTADLSSAGDRVAGLVKWHDQPARVEAQFPATGWRPVESSLVGEQWQLAGDVLHLEKLYAQLRGSMRVDWKNGALTTDLTVEGDPLPKKTVPKTAARLHGGYHAGVFTVESLEVQLPGISAHLDQPVAIDRAGRLKSDRSEFTLGADLARQPWFSAQGALHGRGTITPDSNGLAVVDVDFTAENVSAAGLPSSGMAIAAHFTWPKLEVRTAKLDSAGGTHVVAGGSWDFRQHELQAARIDGHIGAAFLAKWIPEYARLSGLTMEGSAEGTWPAIEHRVKIEAAGVQLPKLHEFSVVVDAEGRGTSVRTFRATARAKTTQLVASGSADLTRAEIKGLTLSTGGVERLALARPATIQWRPELTARDWRLAGENSAVELDVRWGRAGQVSAKVRHFDSAWIRDLVELPSAAWVLETLTAQGSWSNGPASYTAQSRVTFDLGESQPGQLTADLRGDAKGLEVVSLRGSEGAGVIVEASGHLPLTFHPGTKPLTNLDADAPFSLSASTAPNPEFWQRMAELSGVEVVQPHIQAQLKGKLSAPLGEVTINADRLAPVPGRFKFPWPKIEALSAHLLANQQGVALQTFSLQVDGQEVRVSGRLPAIAAQWRDLAHAPLAALRQGDWRIEIPDADLAAVAHQFPAYLAPKGKLRVDLAFKPDETVTGFIRLEDATSRPIGPLGVLQEVNADLQFRGRTVNLDQATARMGGQLITLRGKADLPPGAAPRLDFSLRGENLPFVRQSGFLVRGDLDLKFRSDQRATLIDGEVRLRDSLFLTDLSSFIPSGAKGSARRPPYFSVDAEPLNRWRLNVTVKGQRFLRLRTPLFHGVASARFNLGGTLGNPRASGEATLDEGTIRLPFASFDVKQGQVRITPDQPEPQLMVNATTRRYGYDLRLELTGTASAPNLTFSSSPPLESEQILLMVMAGEAPHNEIATTDRQRAARFGAFFGQSLIASLGGDTGGADRLTISSGENISTQGRETYTIEYKLNDKWSLTGEYDEFDDYIGGVKWRFYQKGGKRSDGK